MAYPSDLTDAQWDLLRPLVQPAKRRRGRPHRHDLRPVINGMLYALTGGAQWRALPKDFPPWQRCYHQFFRWSRNGRLEDVAKILHLALRRQEGRSDHPHLLVIDTQTVQTAMGNSPGRKRGA